MKTLCLATVLLIVKILPAQFSIGQRFGVSYSTCVSGDQYAENWNSTIDDIWGKSVEIPIGISIFGKGRLNTGLAFTEKGYGQGSGYLQNYRFNYLQIPVSIGRVFNVGRFEVQPALGAIVGANVRGSGRFGLNGPRFVIGRMNDAEYPFTYGTADQEFALLGKMSFAYALKKNALVLDLSYQYGLTDVMYDVTFVDINGQTIPSPKAMHRSLVLQVGYRIDLSAGSTTSRIEEDTTAVRSNSKIKFGHRGGLTLSTMSFDGTLLEENQRIIDGSEALLGMTAAWTVDIPLNNRISLRPEIAYMQKGWQTQWYPRPSIANDILRMNYLELPITIHYRMMRGKFTPILLAGPAIGRGVGGRWNYMLDSPSMGPLPVSEVPAFSIANWGFAPIDVSVIAGIGGSFRTSSVELYADIRYQHSLTNFYKGKRVWLESEAADVYHRNWMLNIGYLIPW